MAEPPTSFPALIFGRWLPGGQLVGSWWARLGAPAPLLTAPGGQPVGNIVQTEGALNAKQAWETAEPQWELRNRYGDGKSIAAIKIRFS